MNNHNKGSMTKSHTMYIFYGMYCDYNMRVLVDVVKCTSWNNIWNDNTVDNENNEMIMLFFSPYRKCQDYIYVVLNLF